MKLLLLLLLSLPLTVAAQEETPISALDFPRQIVTDQFIFFPAKQDFMHTSKAGRVWFTKFFNTVDEIEPSERGKNFVEMGISVRTEAFDKDKGKYEDFFADPDHYDSGRGQFWTPRPYAEVCQIGEKLRKLILWHESVITNSGWNSAPCNGALTVHKNKVKDVERLLKANKGINVNTQFKGCSKGSPIVRFSDIAKELLSQGTIDKTWGKGHFFEIMWTTYRMAETKPEIFGKFAKEASTDFLSKLYERGKDDMPIVQVDATIHNEFYLNCKPETYSFTYGD